jgi:hypothetical protein
MEEVLDLVVVQEPRRKRSAMMDMLHGRLAESEVKNKKGMKLAMFGGEDTSHVAPETINPEDIPMPEVLRKLAERVSLELLQDPNVNLVDLLHDKDGVLFDRKGRPKRKDKDERGSDRPPGSYQRPTRAADSRNAYIRGRALAHMLAKQDPLRYGTFTPGAQPILIDRRKR